MTVHALPVRTAAIGLGDRIRRYRIDVMHMTLREFAAATNYSASAIGRCEHDNPGSDDPAARRLAQEVSRAHGASLDWLLYGTVPEPDALDTEGYREPSTARPAHVIVLADYRAQRAELPMVAGM